MSNLITTASIKHLARALVSFRAQELSVNLYLRKNRKCESSIKKVLTVARELFF